MAFNTVVQKLLKLAGLYLEVGTQSFTDAGLTKEVATKCRTKIVCGFGVTQDATAVYQDAVITHGSVTFTRAAGGTAGAAFDYILFGY